MSEDGFNGKWVLVSGASSGFGTATALRFAREGAQLLLGARRVPRLHDVAARCLKSGAARCEVQPLDVTSNPSVQAFFDWVRGMTPRVDVLVNNAGGAHGLEPVEAGSDEDWESMLQTNVLGVLRMTRACLPFLRLADAGTLINIGSIAGRWPYENGAAYCASKAGALAISKALRLELCGSGIRVFTVDPGMAETEFALVRFKGDASRASKVYEGVVPLKADDVAEAIFWVASRPSHVCVDEMVIQCTDQAAVHKVHRRLSPSPSHP